MTREPIDLAGLPFVAKSGNGGIVQLLAADGLRFLWKAEPTAEDRREFESWISRKLPEWKLHVFLERSPGIDASHRAYREFKKASE
jgi:hypothetical protein